MAVRVMPRKQRDKVARGPRLVACVTNVLPLYHTVCGTVERWSLTGELSLSCDRPAADG